MLFLFLLVGLAFAQMPEECLQGEFLANGRFTGQNIDMNYDNTALLTDGGATKLRVAFFVPRRYTESIEADAFAITFNRNLQATVPNEGESDEVPQGLFVGQDSAEDQSACYSNRYDNYTYCDNGGDNDLWTVEQNGDNECIMDAYADVLWEDVMADAMGNPEVITNGRFTEVYLTATVETWTHFNDYNQSDYYGQMTGAEQWLNTDVDNGDTNRQGRYGGDGGWQGAGDPSDGNFGPIIMDDERYTLYQIPFILRFPKTVMVQTSFQVASPVAILTGVVAQDIVTVNKNPQGGNFAVLEAVLTTQVQAPYAVRGPETDDDGGDTAGITVVVGASIAGGDDHAAGVEFVEFDDSASCGDLQVGEMCEQTFKVRITPHANTPCTVAGQYTFEFWLTCGIEDGCALDELVDNESVENRRQSNAYATQTINIAHQPFCPVLVDEVRVVGDFRVYHDESFSTLIGQVSDVFTNDQLFFEAEYRTASAKATDDFDGFEANDFDSAVGDDSMIDFVRATKIFMDVTIGQDSNGDALENWDDSNWQNNFDFTGDQPSENDLGNSHIPGSDITGEELTVTQANNDAYKYNIELCSVESSDAGQITFSRDDLFDNEDVLQDCFTSKTDIAVDYLDMTKVMLSKEDSNTIDENEIAFNMRMDERIIPLKEATDGSFVTVTIESEVYYKGNRNPTRRLLQASPADRRQQHSMTTSYAVFARQNLKKCNVANEQTEGHIQMSLTFNDADDMPTTAYSLDWAAQITHQLENYLGVQGVVKVAELAQCTEDHKCQSIYVESRAPRRRLDNAAYLKVDLKIESTKEVPAGVSLNRLQDHIINRRSELHVKVQAFRKSDVTGMAVAGCGEEAEERPPAAPRDGPILSAPQSELELESSAAALSTLVATLVGLWALRL